jgi:hypothetical protein
VSRLLYGLPRREVDSTVDRSAILSPAGHRGEVKEREVLHDQIHRELMSAYDELLSVAMRVLLGFSAVVENGYDQ